MQPYRAVHNCFCNRACWRRYTGETTPERAARESLEEAGIAFRQEVAIGKYSADFLIGERLVVEVDGEYWHRDPQRDARRDTYLRDRGFDVLRFAEADAASVARVVQEHGVALGEGISPYPRQLTFALR